MAKSKTASVEQQIKESTCFGLAYDPKVKECKICEVALKCESKCRNGNIEIKEPVNVVMTDIDDVTATPEQPSKQPSKAASQKATKKSTNGDKKPKKEKPPKNYSPDMPDLSKMSDEELDALGSERGIDVEALHEKFSSSVNIYKMHLKMRLKKTYEI